MTKSIVNELRQLSNQSIEQVLTKEALAKKHYWFYEEADFVSRVYHGIARRSSLLSPYENCGFDSRPTLHVQFPLNRISGFKETEFVDLAIVKQTSTIVDMRDGFHQHMCDLIGIIEVKKKAREERERKSLADDITRIGKLLMKFKEAWGIMVIIWSYGNTRSKLGSTIDLLRRMEKDRSVWNRFDIISEYSDNATPWKPRIIEKQEFLANLSNTPR